MYITVFLTLILCSAVTDNPHIAQASKPQNTCGVVLPFCGRPRLASVTCTSSKSFLLIIGVCLPSCTLATVFENVRSKTDLSAYA
jgi:hypothetical protein